LDYSSKKFWLAARARGVLMCAVVAIASVFIAQHYHTPVMLIALLLGIALNFLSRESSCALGVDFTARTVLRIGVALLGLRISLVEVAQLGWPLVLMVVLGVVLTIGFGIVLARLMGFQAIFGLLTGGAVAICGASAALALSAALPNHPMKEKATLFTVIGVSALSTLAMVLYPIIARSVGMTELQAGLFIGATIHDVAQVVGAGYSISTAAGDAATLVKLLRVAMLVPVIAFAAWVTHRLAAADGERGEVKVSAPILPWFAVAFVVLATINSLGVIPAAVTALGKSASQWCLTAAMVGIGMKTHLQELTDVGWKPVALMVAETAVLAGGVCAWLFY
jgi:uncharacterized integral membrane protein (TIGR00698 family)